MSSLVLQLPPSQDVEKTKMVTLVQKLESFFLFFSYPHKYNVCNCKSNVSVQAVRQGKYIFKDVLMLHMTDLKYSSSVVEYETHNWYSVQQFSAILNYYCFYGKLLLL